MSKNTEEKKMHHRIIGFGLALADLSIGKRFKLVAQKYSRGGFNPPLSFN
jgi:hypothetical protein